MTELYLHETIGLCFARQKNLKASGICSLSSTPPPPHPHPSDACAHAYKYSDRAPTEAHSCKDTSRLAGCAASSTPKPFRWHSSGVFHQLHCPSSAVSHCFPSDILCACPACRHLLTRKLAKIACSSTPFKKTTTTHRPVSMPKMSER